MPVPILLEGDQIDGLLWLGLATGKRVRITFKDSCQPEDVTQLVDMRGRKFIEFGEGSHNNIRAVYLSQDGWGNVSRSFIIRILDNTSTTSREKFSRLANRLQCVEVFDD